MYFDKKYDLFPSVSSPLVLVPYGELRETTGVLPLKGRRDELRGRGTEGVPLTVLPVLPLRGLQFNRNSSPLFVPRKGTSF